MKNIFIVIAFLLCYNLSFANDKLLAKARELSANKEYVLAIKEYKKQLKYIKVEDLKNLFLEIANCYFLSDDKNKAIKFIKDSIIKYGLTEDVFIYNETINEELSKYALEVLYDDLDKMQEKYIDSLD